MAGVKSQIGTGVILGAVLTFAVSVWLSFGRAFFHFSSDTVPLMPASTELCYVNNSVTFNYTMPYTPTTPRNSTSSFNMTSSITQLESAQGIEVLYSLSPFVYGPMATVFCIFVSIIASFILGHKESDKVEEKYISHFALKIWGCTPVVSRYIKKRDLIKTVKMKLLKDHVSYDEKHHDETDQQTI